MYAFSARTADTGRLLQNVSHSHRFCARKTTLKQFLVHFNVFLMADDHHLIRMLGSYGISHGS